MVIPFEAAATSSEEMVCTLTMQETGILKTSFRFYQRFFCYTQQARNSDETQETETTQSNVPDDDSSLLAFHPKSEEHGEQDKAEKRRASFNSLSYGRAALVLSLLTFTAGVCPGAGSDLCDVKGLAVSKGEVTIACPLTADVNQTKQSILIKYFNPLTDPEDVLECDWMSSEQEFHCLQSRFRTELIAIKRHRVLAILPEDCPKNGTYRCQLVPSHPVLYTDCKFCCPDNPNTVPTSEASKTTEAPKPLSSNRGHHELGELGIKASGRSGGPKQQIPVRRTKGQDGGLVTAVVILSIIVLCLVLAMAAMVLFFLCYRRRMKQTDKRTPQETERFTAGTEAA